MSKIVERISAIPDLQYLEGCSMEQIEDAQKKLGMVFPDEYKEYVKEFGAICFFGTEWTGLNVDGYLNTVEATKQEMGVNKKFPSKCFVLEDIGIDAKLAIVDEEGNVFILQRDKKELLCKSISEYLDICCKRN